MRIINSRTDSHLPYPHNHRYSTQQFERVSDATGSFDLDRLPPGADEDTTELQAEIEELEQRITELISFDSETSYHTRSTGG
jgi:hypothetical protein